MITLNRLKDGATVSDTDGTIYKLINQPQVFDVGEHELDVEVYRVARCERLRDKRIMRFKPNREVILLEGDKIW